MALEPREPESLVASRGFDEVSIAVGDRHGPAVGAERQAAHSSFCRMVLSGRPLPVSNRVSAPSRYGAPGGMRSTSRVRPLGLNRGALPDVADGFFRLRQLPAAGGVAEHDRRARRGRDDSAIGAVDHVLDLRPSAAGEISLLADAHVPNPHVPSSEAETSAAPVGCEGEGTDRVCVAAQGLQRRAG